MRESERDEALPTVLVLVRFALVALVVAVTPLFVVAFTLTVVVGSVTRAFCLHAQLLLLLRCLSRTFCCCCCHGNANANLPTVLHCVQCCFWNITNFMAFNWNFICQLMNQHTSYAICSPSLSLPPSASQFVQYYGFNSAWEPAKCTLQCCAQICGQFAVY